MRKATPTPEGRLRREVVSSGGSSSSLQSGSVRRRLLAASATTGFYALIYCAKRPRVVNLAAAQPLFELLLTTRRKALQRSPHVRSGQIRSGQVRSGQKTKTTKQDETIETQKQTKKGTKKKSKNRNTKNHSRSKRMLYNDTTLFTLEPLYFSFLSRLTRGWRHHGPLVIGR